MKPNPAPSVQSIQWLPAARLGALTMDGNLRPWLIGKGLLSARLRSVCGERYALRLVDQWSGVLSDSHKFALRTDDHAGLFRDVELYCADQVWVFAQTVTPDSTLSLHPWLAELGDTALDATLESLSGTERSSHEYAWLPAVEARDGLPPDATALTVRALRGTDAKPAGLWARRSRVALRGAPLLIQEVFLPAVGCF